jgi:hypothetical protein
VAAAVHFVVGIYHWCLTEIASKSEMAREPVDLQGIPSSTRSKFRMILGFVESTVARNPTIRTPIMEICDWILSMSSSLVAGRPSSFTD